MFYLVDTNVTFYGVGKFQYTSGYLANYYGGKYYYNPNSFFGKVEFIDVEHFENFQNILASGNMNKLNNLN